MDKKLVKAQTEINGILEKYEVSYSEAFTLLSFMSYSILGLMQDKKKP